MTADPAAGVGDEEATSVDSVARQAGRGLRWSLVAGLATKVGSFAMGLVLARLLVPADFGVYAVALAATGFVLHVNDVGLIAATVQWPGRFADVAPTATTLAGVFSAAVYGLFWLAAPQFAELAGSPTAAPVIRLLTAVILVDGIVAIRVAALQREFRQDRLAVANMIGFAIQAPVAVSLAAGGAGPYAFAAGQLAQSAVAGAMILRWARVPVRLGLDRAVGRRLLGYGIPLAAGLGVEALLINADYVVVGRLLGAEELGFYLLAFNVSSWMAGTVGTAIRYVSVAGFARLAERDGALSDGVGRSVPVLLTGALPVAVLIGVLAEPLVAFLYGARWTPAAAALGALMALAVIRLLTGLTLDVLMGSGATRSMLWINLGWAAALVPALIVGTRLGGIAGTALGHVAVGLVVALPLSALALHRAGVALAPIGPALVRPLVAAATAGAVAAAAARLVGPSPLLQLLAGGGLGVACYVLAGFPRDQLRQAATRIRARAR